MTRNKFPLFLLIIVSNSILTIDKEKKWLFGGIATFITYNFLAYKYEKMMMNKEFQNLQAQIAKNQEKSQQAGSILGENLPTNEIEMNRLQEKEKYIREHETKYLLTKLTFHQERPMGGFWLCPNILGIGIYMILKIINEQKK